MLLKNLVKGLLISMVFVTVANAAESGSQVFSSTQTDNQIVRSESAETDLPSILNILDSGIPVEGWRERYGRGGTGINNSPVYLFMVGSTNCLGAPKSLEDSINRIPNISKQDVIRILQNTHDSARNLFDCYVTQNSAREHLDRNLKSAIFETRFLVLALQNQSQLLSEDFVRSYYKDMLNCMFGPDELSAPGGVSDSTYPRGETNLDKTLFRYINQTQLDDVFQYYIDLLEQTPTKMLLDDDNAESNSKNFDNPVEGNGEMFLFKCDSTQSIVVPKLDFSNICDQNSRENPYPNGCSTPYEVPRMPSAIPFP